MDTRNRKIFSYILLLSFAVFSCTASNTTKGAAAGATVGGIIGGIIGDNNDNTAAGVLIGAAIGGAAGAYIGRYMDKQVEKMERDLENAKIERVGEGIKITFDSGILFPTNGYTLQPAAKENISKLAVILNKYPDTNLLIEGHTDITGPMDFNMELSEKRARSVSDFTKTQGVNSQRISIVGHGPNHPVASNMTNEGRQQNRRVDIAVFANEKLKKVAIKK